MFRIFIALGFSESGSLENRVRAYAMKVFSKLRSSQAGLCQWRLTNDPKSKEGGWLVMEADYAFRQAHALCPYSPEALYRYVNFC